jgi:hypothetical protein
MPSEAYEMVVTSIEGATITYQIVSGSKKGQPFEQTIAPSLARRLRVGKRVQRIENSAEAPPAEPGPPVAPQG